MIPADIGEQTTQRSPGRSSVFANTFWLYGLRGLDYLVTAAMLPFFVRVLGVEQYGLMALAQAVAQYLTVATDYGFNFSATRSVAHNRDDSDALARIFWTVTTVKLIFLVIAAIGTAALVLSIPLFQADAKVYFAACIGVIGNALFPTWLFQGLERMRAITLITGLAKFAAALAILLLVRGNHATVLATFLQSAGLLVAGSVGLMVGVRTYVRKLYIPSGRDLLGALADGWHFFVSTASITLFTTTNTFLVGVIAGNVQAGYFSLGEKVIRAITCTIVPFLQAAYPHVVRAAKTSQEAALAFVRHALRVSVAAGMAAGMAIVLFAPTLAAIAFRHDAQGVVPLLRILAPFPVLAVVTSSMGLLIYMPLGLEKALSRLLIGVGVANVLLGLALIPRWGALGAGAGMVVMESAQMLAGWFILRRSGITLLPSPLAVPGSAA